MTTKLTFNNCTWPCLTSSRLLSAAVVGVSCCNCCGWVADAKLVTDRAKCCFKVFSSAGCCCCCCLVGVVAVLVDELVEIDSKSTMSWIVLRRWIRKCLLTNDAELVSFFLFVILYEWVVLSSGCAACCCCCCDGRWDCSLIRNVLRLLG